MEAEQEENLEVVVQEMPEGVPLAEAVAQLQSMPLKQARIAPSSRLIGGVSYSDLMAYTLAVPGSSY